MKNNLSSELSEMFIRFANGGFTNVITLHGGVLFIWDKNINPLEVGGVQHKGTNVRFDALASLNNSEHNERGLSLFLGETETKNYFIIVSNIDIINNLAFLRKRLEGIAGVSKIGEESKGFKTLFETLSYIRDNYSPTGKVVILKENHNQDVVVSKWTLHKDTYTNQEVVLLLEEFKQEMLESTNQLFNRFINRINK